MITSLQLPHHHVMRHVKSLSLMIGSNNDWWHGISSKGDMAATRIFVLNEFFYHWCLHPPKGYLTLWSPRGNSIIKTSMFSGSFNASFVGLIFPIFFMYAFNDVPQVPMTTTTHEHQPSTWKYPILTRFMQIFHSCLNSALGRSNDRFLAQGRISKCWRA